MGPLMYFKHANYKYQLTRDITIRLPRKFWPVKDFENDFIKFTIDGWLTIKKGYAWDGCSGPTKDDDTNMFAGLVHDLLYQLIRLGVLPVSCRPEADLVLQRTCRANGMWKLRAWYYFEGVELGAAWAADPKQEPKEETAPANWPE
jgi:hypothetical protein